MIRTRHVVAFVLAMAGCSGAAPVDPARPGAVTVVERGCPAPPANPRADAEAFEKLAAKRIAKSCIYGVGHGDPVRAEGAIRSRAGQVLSASQVHEDVRTLMASGRFEDIEVSAMPQGSEVVVLFVFREGPHIAEVAFEGAALLQKEGLEPRIAPEGNKPITMANVYDAAGIMRDEYHRRGYRDVAIDVVTDNTNPPRTRLKIVVAEGRQLKFGKIAVNGAGKTRKEDLRKATRLEQGTPFDEEQILKAVRGIEEYYLDHGYPNARVASSLGVPASDGSTPIAFDISEGDLVRFGPVTIGSVDKTNIKAPAVDLKSGQGAPYSRAAVDEDVRTLIAAFASRGQKVVVVPRRELDPKKHTIDVVFQVAPAPN